MRRFKLRILPRPEDELDVLAGDGLHRLNGAHHELPVRVAPVAAVAFVIVVMLLVPVLASRPVAAICR